MKGDTLLDYAEFQLTQTRTRCELFVSAQSVTEKLASGFLKPFVTHLRAAEVQVARGRQVIRLDRPANLSKQTDNTWFTKGTLERFVRFVSTPEVIERVKAIEDELAQLEQVRSALATTFAQTEDRFPNIDITLSSSGAYKERESMSIMPMRHSMDVDENGAEASKRELLRAMDVRLISLKQEQDLAFSRAAAAGFDSSNMADLMSFAEHFGADRLGDACMQFMALCRKRKYFNIGHRERYPPSAEAASSGSDMSLESSNEIDLAAELESNSQLESNNSEAWLDGQTRTHPDLTENAEGHIFKARLNEKLTSSVYNGGTRRGLDTRRRWGPPEKLQINYASPQVHSSRDSPESENSTGMATDVIHHDGQDDERFSESEITPSQVGEGVNANLYLKEHSISPQQTPTVLADLNQKPVPALSYGDKKYEPTKGGMFFARLQQMAKQVEARRSGKDLMGSMHSPSMGMSDQSEGGSQVPLSETSSMWLEPSSSESTDSVRFVHHGDQGQSQIYEVTNVLPRSQSPASSSLSGEKDKPGSPWSSSSTGANHSLPQNGVSHENEFLKSVEETQSKDRKPQDDECEPVRMPARRLSVQDAISLFESKKKGKDEVPMRNLVKQDSRKGSMEIGNPSSSEKAVLRRWSGTNSRSPGESYVQEKVSIMDNSECRFLCTEDKSGTKKDYSTDRGLMHDNQCQSLADEQVTERHNISLHDIPKQSVSIQQPSVGCVSLNASSGDLQKQFKAELAKVLKREAKGHEAVSAVITLKSEVDLTNLAVPRTARPLKGSSMDLKNESQSALNEKILDARRKTEKEEKGVLNGPSTKHVPSIIGTSVFNGPGIATFATKEQDITEKRTRIYAKQELVTAKASEIVELKNVADGSLMICKPGSAKLSDEIEHRESRPSLWNPPVDLHMQALVNIVDNQYDNPWSLSSEESTTEHRGRYYEHYQRLRDLKLRSEHPAKRAEREVKLKLMQETLEQRTYEMEARALRPQKMNIRLAQERLRVAKLQAQKTGLMGAEIEQERIRDEEAGADQDDRFLQMPDQLTEYSNPTSPASTPRSSKNQDCAMKPHSVKKYVPALQKSLSVPRASVTIAAASSPKTTSKSPLETSGQWKLPTQGNNGSVDNSIITSVPHMTEWRKETTKPSPGRGTVPAWVQTKVNGHSKTVSATSGVDNGNMIANDDSLSVVTDKEEMKRQSSLIRKSCISASEVKTSSLQTQDAVRTESLNAQDEGFTDSGVNGKVRRNAVTQTQEVKPFLRKGRGIGPGAGAGIMKHKPSAPMDASKGFDEEIPTDLMLSGEADDPNDFRREVVEAEELAKSLATDDMEGLLEHDVSVKSNAKLMHCSNDNQSGYINKVQIGDLEVEVLDYLPEDASNDGRVCDDSICRDDVCERKHEGTLVVDSIPIAQDVSSKTPKCKQKNGVQSAPLVHLLAQINAQSLQSNASHVNTSASFRVASLPHEHFTSPFSPAVTSSANSSIVKSGTISGHFSPPPAMALDSPSGSPASWNSSQVQYPSETDQIRSSRPLSGPQKLPASISAVLPKESAKGFKRLLHFGRKNRGSETITTECISAPMRTEGDNDAEDATDVASRSSDDLLRRTRMQESGFEFGNTVDQYSFQDRGAAQLLRSSIPGPPANFKLREDHLSGGTLLKAPRSFFSLSSFRSRSSEGKSR